MTDHPEICVIRHGQTAWNRAGRYQGQQDSPLGRARQTAALSLAATGHMPREDARLREVAFGAWEGLSWDDFAAQWPERAQMAESEPFLWHFQAPEG